MPGTRILLDQNVPSGLRQVLADHDVVTAYRMGWSALTNGDLISAAGQAGFAVMVTADQNIRHQQNLAGRRLALVVLTTTHWITIRESTAYVLAAIESATAGSYLPNSARRRRTHQP